ncbi:MAG: DCC1-like thiol-disulfide oxidoreductase family protein [Leptospirales bacterium]|nr:DCC1-like thiol-disulfide oxidoreductase family protein [Leptospirales bacterium]
MYPGTISIRQFAIFRLLCGLLALQLYLPNLYGALEAVILKHPGGMAAAVAHSIAYGCAALGALLALAGWARRAGGALLALGPWLAVLHGQFVLHHAAWSNGPPALSLSPSVALFFVLQSAPGLALLLAPAGDCWSPFSSGQSWIMTRGQQRRMVLIALFSATALALLPLYFFNLLPWVLVFLPLLLDRRLLPGRRASSDSPPVVFFDGVCGLCNAAVDFFLAEDFAQKLRFTPLQGNYASKRLPEALRSELQSFALEDGAGLHLRSSAAIRAAEYLGGIWGLAFLLRLIPRQLRDAAYDALASRRYQWFGKHDRCRMPTASERARFLP